MPSKQAQRRKDAKEGQRDALYFRTLSVRAQSIDKEGRSVEAVIATESPVPMYDWDRYERVPEVLRADGAILPSQVPLLDNHARWSTDDQIGSAREVAKEDRQIVGRLHFAADATRQWDLVRDGHITDVSAGYQVIEKTFVPRNTTTKVGGREYVGPVNVVTKWKLREVSLTPIGADEQAKLRGFDPSNLPSSEKDFEMNPQLRALLVSRGMPETLTDEEAQKWIVDNPGRALPPTPTPEPKTIDVDAVVRKALDEHDKAREERGVKFRKDADALLELADLQDLAPRAYALASVDQVRDLILEEKKKRAAELPSGPSIRITGDGASRFVSDIGTALTLRAMEAVPPTPRDGEKPEETRARYEKDCQRVFPTEKRGKGAEQWRNVSLYSLAEEYIRTIYAVDTRGLTREDVAVIAMFGPQRAANMGYQFRAGSPAYHTTGNFTNLTLDAVNKSMQLGYTEAPSTWEGPMRKGTSVPDFKNINRLRLGGIPNLPIWPDNTDPQKASLADAKESYAVECRSLNIGFSYRLLINDDMDSLSRVPGMMGNAARRTVNAVAWAVVTANPDMSDGKALFLETPAGNRKRKNLTTGAGAPSTTTLQTLTNLMMQMRGENTPEQAESEDVLALMPRYLVGPGALRTTILQLVMSVYDASTAGSLAFNMASQLIPVIEPLLDANSTTAWYLFASPGQIDTVEVSFLQGQETPQVRNFMDEENLSQNFTILQTFGAKALNHRGMQKHAGA